MENTVLSDYNIHRRDRHIRFINETHTYLIDFDSSNYTSVTTFVHSLFEKFDSDIIIDKMFKSNNWNSNHKYWGMSIENIKLKWEENKNEVSSAGTSMHYNIECFYNNKNLPINYSHKELYEFYNLNKNQYNHDSIEWKYFINFVKETPHLKPYRTEWCVFNENIKIAGSIDMIYENDDGSLSIYDWKRCKTISRVNNFNKFANSEIIPHLHDTNYWHYALQLNIYKYIIETKYNKIVKDLCIVKLHPDNQSGDYELIPLPILNIEIYDLMTNIL